MFAPVLPPLSDGPLVNPDRFRHVFLSPSTLDQLHGSVPNRTKLLLTQLSPVFVHPHRLSDEHFRRYLFAGLISRGDRLRVHDKTGAESTPEFCADEIMFYNRTVVAVDHRHTAGLFFRK